MSKIITQLLQKKLQLCRIITIQQIDTFFTIFFSSHSTLSTENMVQCSLSCIYLYPTNLSYKFISYKYTARSLNRTLIFKRNIGHFDLSYTVKPATLAELKEHKLSQQLRLNVFLKSLRIKEFLKSLLFPDVLCNRGESLNIRGKKKTHKQKRNDFNLLRVIQRRLKHAKLSAMQMVKQ